jgi:hypothetical protein
MRNTLSGRAVLRSLPNGFSITTRRHEPFCCSARPELRSCSVTSGNDFGGIDR